MEDLQITYMDINELTPYERNTRKHTDNDVQYIVNSIKEFGMKDPIGIWGVRTSSWKDMVDTWLVRN